MLLVVEYFYSVVLGLTDPNTSQIHYCSLPSTLPSSHTHLTDKMNQERMEGVRWVFSLHSFRAVSDLAEKYEAQQRVRRERTEAEGMACNKRREAELK